MTTRTEQLAAERAVAAWRAKRQLSRPPGFSEEEANEITGVEELDCMGSIPYDFERDGEMWSGWRYDEDDLFKVLVLATLRRAGVPLLVRKLIDRDFEDRSGPRFGPLEGALKSKNETAYPLNYQLADQWTLVEYVQAPERCIWGERTTEQIASAIRERNPELTDAEVLARANERAAERNAENAETMALVASGEAMLCREWELAEQLQASINAFWIKAGGRPAP